MAEPNLKMDFKGQHILSAKQFDKKGLLVLFEEAKKMEKVFANGESDILKGKILASLFFEPSTRTRFSFEISMLRLGGKVVSNFDMLRTSSLKKFETLYDTGKCISQMVDVIVMRHPDASAVTKLAQGSDVPVISAGEGAEEHPTQALLDLYTIWKEKGGFDGLTIGMVGDLKYSRVQHSQCELLKHFDVKFIFVSSPGLKMPDGIVMTLSGHNVTIGEHVDDFVPEMDVISVSRVQSERFPSEEEYKKYAGTFVINEDVMKRAKKDALLLHPLPRVDEIAFDVDIDPRAKYFEQIKNGVAVRMALLKLILG